MEVKTIPHSGHKYLKFSIEEIEEAKVKISLLIGLSRVTYHHNPYSILDGSYNSGKEFENFIYWECEASSTINPMNGQKGDGFRYICFCPKKIN